MAPAVRITRKGSKPRRGSRGLNRMLAYRCPVCGAFYKDGQKAKHNRSRTHKRAAG